MNIVDFLVETTLVKSKSEGVRLIEQGGCYLNGIKILDKNKNVTLADSIQNKFFLLRKGKKGYLLVKLVD